MFRIGWGIELWSTGTNLKAIQRCDKLKYVGSSSIHQQLLSIYIHILKEACSPFYWTYRPHIKYYFIQCELTIFSPVTDDLKLSLLLVFDASEMLKPAVIVYTAKTAVDLKLIHSSGSSHSTTTQIAIFMWPKWGPPGSCRPQVGPMLAPWSLLSGYMHQAMTDSNNGLLSTTSHLNQCWFIANCTFRKQVWINFGSKYKIDVQVLDAVGKMTNILFQPKCGERTIKACARI